MQEHSIDRRNYYTEGMITLGRVAVVTATDTIVNNIFKYVVFKPLLSILVKIRDLIGERRRLEDAIVRIQEAISSSNKKILCLIAFDVVSCYMLMKARKKFINSLVSPAMFYVKNKCFSKCISDEIVKSIFSRNRHDGIYLCVLSSILNRVNERVHEIREQRRTVVTLRRNQTASNGEIQQPIEIGVIEETQEFRVRENHSREIDLLRDIQQLSIQRHRHFDINQVFTAISIYRNNINILN